MLHWNEAGWMAFLASLALKTTALLTAAWLCAWMLRKRSASARHLVWTAAFAAALGLPALSVALPALQLPGAGWLTNVPALVFRVSATAAPTASVASPVAAVGTAAGHAFPTGSSFNWPLWIALICCGGTLVLLAQTAIAYLRMARVRRGARAFRGEFNGRLPEGVALLEAAAGSMPMTFGVRRPVVFLPADAPEWSEERRDMVVRHELAHIERGDVATHLMARAALSVAWWNPLAWMAWREFLKEREKAADDLVLSGGARASDYAGHLLEIARSMHAEPATAWAAVAMARRSQLEGRLLSILDTGVSRKAARRASVLAACAAAIALCAPFAAVRAQNQQAQLPPDVDATIRAAAAQKNHEILDTAAAAFERLRKFDTAQALLTTSLEIRAAVSGEGSKEYAAGLVKLGDLETERSRKSEAAAFYQKAVSLGDSAETAKALVYLGTNSMERKDFGGATDFFRRAIAVSNSADVTGRAYMWMAMTEQTNPDHAGQAEENFRQAIATLEPNSSSMATALLVYAKFLEKRDRAAEAEPLMKQQSAIVEDLMRKTPKQESAFRAAELPGSGGATRPQLIYKVEPEYTEEARVAKFQGVVVLSVVIGADGVATNARVIKSLGLGLDEKAIESVSQWKFKPGTKDGEPVPVQATIEVNFRLL